MSKSKRSSSSTSAATLALWNVLRRRPITLTATHDTLVGNREEGAMSKPKDLLQGTLDLLVLTVVANEPMHGWAIGQRLRQMSCDVLQVSPGSLYPGLHK